jgi:hypothetical protein
VYCETTPWSIVLLVKLTVTQFVSKCPTLYVTWRFITVFIRSRHWCLFRARWIHSTPSKTPNIPGSKLRVPFLLLGSFQRIRSGPNLCVTFCNMSSFYGQRLAAPPSNTQPAVPPVTGSSRLLINKFASTLHIWSPFPEEVTCCDDKGSS